MGEHIEHGGGRNGHEPRPDPGGAHAGIMPTTTAPRPVRGRVQQGGVHRAESECTGRGAPCRWTASGVAGGQGPEAPVAPSTTFTSARGGWPATAVTWYSPGRTCRAVPVQPGDEVFRSHERRRTAGVFLSITIMLDPSPLTQSAELQTRWPETVTTTDTNLAPMSNRHGCLLPEVAWTTNRGVVPGWYQYCGDETRSVTAPAAQAKARL